MKARIMLVWLGSAIIACMIGPRLAQIAEAQTAVARPSLTAMGTMVPVQVKLTGLTSAGYTWNPSLNIIKFAISPNNPNGDVYLGQSQRDRAGKLAVGAVVGGSSPQVTIADLTGFKLAISWGAEANTPLRANNSYTLDALSGAWLQGGFKISCTDGNSGTDCGNINAELFWQQ